MVKNGNKIWEFGNELNMSSPDIGGAGEGIGKSTIGRALCEMVKSHPQDTVGKKRNGKKSKLYLSVLPVLTKYSWKNSSH